jgi:predicted adenylyl cyclase CyaB
MEIERKAKLRNKARLLTYLKANKFDKKGEKHQIDTYFEPELGINFEGKYLRVREDLIKKTNSLDFHIARDDFATEEYETKIDNPEIARRILKELKMKERCVVDKKRESFQKGNVTIEIDDVKGLGDFVEVEIISDNEKDSQKEVMRILSEIGVEENDIVSGAGYPDLIAQKNQQE